MTYSSQNHSTLQACLSSIGPERLRKFGLERIKHALKEHDNPEQTVHSLVIGGTNGKGSTALFLTNVLKEAGYRTGTYTSPHLYSVTERFRLNGEPAEIEELDAIAQICWPTADRLDLSYFEFLTLCYFVWAREQKLDFSILEVGLGGRLDATNVTRPIACAITSLSHDHEDYLGHELSGILREKLAIVPDEGLCFSGIADPELKTQLQKHCDDIDAIYYHASELKKEVLSRHWNGQSVLINGYPFELTSPDQATLNNAALTLLLVRIIFPVIDMDIVRRGFASTELPGRFEVFTDSPRIILSGAHNPAGIQMTLDSLKAMTPERIRAVCAFSTGKDYETMLSQLGEHAIPTAMPDHPAPYADHANFIADPRQAILSTLGKLEPGETLLIIGSIYFLSLAREILETEAPGTSEERSCAKLDASNLATAQPVVLKQTPVPPTDYVEGSAPASSSIARHSKSGLNQSDEAHF